MSWHTAAWHNRKCVLLLQDHTLSWSMLTGLMRSATASMAGTLHASLDASPLAAAACGSDDAMALLRLTGTSSAACPAPNVP